ncbi:MAG TPA: hypothetical protein VGP57_22015 [Actinoplanes sp.]|nr:hypothetical protein [Actinoplanes sp.]
MAEHIPRISAEKGRRSPVRVNAAVIVCLDEQFELSLAFLIDGIAARPPPD